MKERKHYISLTFKGSNAWHHHGKRQKLTERIVNIGETADCDVRYEAGDWQPEYYATIIQNEDGKSWRIVRRSQHVSISIDGKGTIGYAHLLSDGDLIRFDNQPMALYFHSHDDDRYDDESKTNPWQWVAAGLLAVVALMAVVLNFMGREARIGAEDVEPIEESVYLVKVDSVCRLLLIDGEQQQRWWLKGDGLPMGTAFLTTDGKMVTARHCVEYWLGADLDLTTKVADLADDDIVRWAIETETFNQTHPSDTVMRLQVWFSLYDFMGNKKYSFSSTDKRVHINTEKDGIFMLADFSQSYYWRSIRPYFTNREMELGDILWIDSIPEQGKVRLASIEQLNEVKSGTPLMICGYPMTGIGDKRMTFTEGTIRRRASAKKENLFFESNINHGFSGGPVLMKAGSDVIAIGVVSRVDSVSSGLYKWAVPVSEIHSGAKRHSQVEN